ncbi:unnamed protein product [Symbiodinium microadriaticum]|nr:unnamed protein product [Symbiodinium microadriaticum]CAE7937519.1 unnamed protein product [Symbiodinium sp. KB8]
MMGLTRTLVGYGSSADYPTGNWFKGADTVSLCKFLEHKFASVLVGCEPDERPYVRNILAMLRACNTFMSTMYHGDVFLTDDERSILIRNGYVVTGKFAACASHAYLTLNIPRYKYQPKYHFFAEVVFKLERDQRAGVTSVNPVLESTQVDEDFIGRISKFSREVSSRTLHVRTCKKYLMALASQW